MSRYDYEFAKKISALDPPFYALIMAAMKDADSRNLEVLQRFWPSVWSELLARYNAPSGVLEGD